MGKTAQNDTFFIIARIGKRFNKKKGKKGKKFVKNLAVTEK